MAEKKKVCREIVTIGLPLPNLLEYTADVSPETRDCLLALKKFSEKVGIQTHEIKARSINVASNHSNLVSKMVGDWILICGSDHTFDPNLLDELLKATAQPPYPKIIGAVCNYRGAPYRWTLAKSDSSGERFYPLVPFYNCDPAVMSSGEIQEVDVIGSGVTLYHRSVFDAVPPPWFTYESRRPSMKELEDVLRDWDGDIRLDEWFEKLARLDDNISLSEGDAIRLKEKAKKFRGLLAKFRRPNAMGMDYGICLKAKDYGIKTYVHWGCVTHHLTLEHSHPQRYVHWLESDRNNWTAEVMAREDLTFESIAKIRNINDEADRKRKEWEQAVAEAQLKLAQERSNEDAENTKGMGSRGLEGQDTGRVLVEREGSEVHEEEGAY